MASQSFDYLVVGGGVGGLVVATRLAEDPKITVGVIEAGQDTTTLPEINANVHIPAFLQRNLTKPEVDWTFMSTPQAGANNRPIYLPRGKGLGGSTLLNFMQLARGRKGEYDAFEKLGNPGWNWEGLLEYFKKSETFTYKESDIEKYDVQLDPNAHGTSGPIQRIFPRWISEQHFNFIEAFKALGVPYNRECNNGDNTGVWTNSCAIDPVSATRSSAATGYYEPNRSKSNLVTILGARATRVIFKSGDGNKVAEGVEYIQDGKTIVATAKKEVILAAGTYQTPQLLELSGIGAKKVLEANKIPVLIDLPGVGNNLQDHLWTTLTAEMDSKYESLDTLLNDPARAGAEWQLYESKKEGMFASITSVFAFLPRNLISNDSTILQSAKGLTLDHVPGISSGAKKAFELQKEWLTGDEPYPFLEIAQIPAFFPALGTTAAPGKTYFTFFVGLAHPFSRGSVHIGSSDPTANPVIDPRYLDNDVDTEIMINGLKIARKAIATPALNSVITQEITPGPDVQSDADLKNYIRDTMLTTYHPTGTASMFPREEGGVVDPTLKVYGTENLRIVDASIIPIQISAHVQASLYAIAEKAADIIKANP
ncbi:hypothetical protein PLICRDRAFT_47109 [Plicaturopsis crispa FD-325 SS-3]|uniref:Glucose-methanol-choline oxidoreductase N-terminal domain-containing protein n=1 Tax=Plicaturopsis crispa FD-325 SS-3 TaxID=944288 RepID=A0A0C9SQD6_PLICR|nr:hypothetical protein PLICRDRAFT_47109 [Plicaturopsis crispa FD-325 SS-3]